MWFKINEPICSGPDDHNRNSSPGEILLVLQPFIDAYEYIKTRLCQCQQLAIFDPGPSSLLNSAAIVTPNGKKGFQFSWSALVQKHSHL
jgi:hypothetical protein